MEKKDNNGPGINLNENKNRIKQNTEKTEDSCC